MKSLEHLYENIKNDIYSGKYGKSGNRFLSIREICQKYKISFSSGYNLYQKLESEYLINLVKQKWFLTYGIADNESDIKTISSKKLIGLHAKEIDNPYITAIISELQSTLKQIGFSLIIQTSENNPLEEREILNNFIAMGCIGVFNFPSVDKLLFPYYKNYPLPMIFIGRTIKIDDDHNMPCVLTDNFTTGKSIAHILYEKDYKSFYFVGHEKLPDAINERLSGFSTELNKNGDEIFSTENIFKTDYADTANIKHFCRTIAHKASNDSPIAIFCINDLFAAKILTVLISLGVDIPNSVGIIGYDDLPICQYTSPTITSVSYSFKEIAFQATKLLFSVNDNSTDNLQINIPNFVIQRKSTARKTQNG